jgi:hypothetical protein
MSSLSAQLPPNIGAGDILIGSTSRLARWNSRLALTTTRLLGAGLGAAVMLAAIVTVVFHGEYVRAAPPAIVLVLLAIIAWAVL